MPHLLFTGSLEVNRRPLTDQKTRQAVASWSDLAQHAREFGYNRKIDGYRQMEHDLRKIHEMRPRKPEPLDLEVVVVKPEWLCGTFGFHPMLGFRRRQQVASIAHGCWSTLRAVSQMAHSERRDWLRAWGVKGDFAKPAGWCRQRLRRDQQRAGGCWWVPNVTCPFSKAALLQHGGKDREQRKTPPGLFDDAAAVDEIAAVHACCGQEKTHRPPA